MTTKKYFNKANRSGLPVRENFSGYEYPTVKDSGLTDDQYIAKYGVMPWTAYGNSTSSNATQSRNQKSSEYISGWIDVLMGKNDNSSENQETKTKTNYIYYILLAIVVVVLVVALVKFSKK